MEPIVHPTLNLIGIPPLWELGHRGSGVTVAVLDSGIIPDPSFADSIIYDEDFTGEGKSRAKDYWHGTSIATCINIVAPEAAIANLRVVPTGSDMTKDMVIKALEHCMDVYPKYRVINISLSFAQSGCSEDCPLCRMVDETYRKGMLVIVAAGNKGPKPNTLTCPARAKWAIANIATWTKSQEKQWQELGALKRFWYKDITGKFGKEHGTSFSAAWTSGAAAVLFSAFPKLDADTMRFAVVEVAEELRKEVGHHTTLKFDRVYNYLHRLQSLISVGAMVTKTNSLRELIKPF